jgi:hypothetical protein
MRKDQRMTTSKADIVQMRGWMRREQAAAYCGVSPRTLSDWQARRLIPFAKVSHRVCLFRAADLDKALGKLIVEAVSP